MQCSKVQAQISALVASEYSHRPPSVGLSNPADQSINSDSRGYQELSNWQRRRLQRHCHACSDCRKQWEQTQRLWAGMKSVAAEATPDRIRAAVFAALPDAVETAASLSIWPSNSYTTRRKGRWHILCEAIPILGTLTVTLCDIVTEIPMPKSRGARFTLALFVVIMLGITGRNGYQRYLDYRLVAALQETVHQQFSNGSEALAARKALVKRKLAAVRSLLAKGANPNQRVDRYDGSNTTPDFESALSYAFGDMDESDNSADSEAIICLLIQHGADISVSTAAKDFRTETDSYLQHASQKGSLSILRCLLARNPHPDEADLSAAFMLSGYAVIEQATASNKIEAERVRSVRRQRVDLLREHGAMQALLRTQSPLVALNTIIHIDDIPDIKAQLEAGLPADPPDVHYSFNNSLPLYEAARCRNIEAAKLLLEHGANVNRHQISPHNPYDTPLCVAARTGNIALLKLLLAHGANVNDGDGRTPLEEAILCKHPEAAKLLRAYGANPNYHPKRRSDSASASLTPANAVTPQITPQHTPDLLKPGTDVNSNNGEPLRNAIYARRLDLVRDLLRHGANVNPVRPFTQTGFPIFSPLAVAVFNAPELEETLRRAGARLDAVDKLNCLATALNASKLKQQYTFVNLPLRPLDMSQKENQRKLLLKLLALGVDINAVDDEGETPLTQAVQHMPASVGLLLEHGANPNVIPRDPRLPLELAAKSGQEENVRLLLAHGADPNAYTARSHTALYWARRHNYTAIAALLKQAGATLDQ